MSTDVIALPQHQQSASTGLLRKIFDVFFSPERAFSSLRESPTWWLPFVLTVICSYTLMFTAAQRIGFRQLAANVMQANNPQGAEGASPEQQAAALDTGETVFKISSFSAPGLILVYNLAYSFFIWTSLNIFAGGRAEFRSIFAVLLWADLIQDLRNLLTIVAVYTVNEPSHLNMQNALGSNVAYYLNPSVQGWLRALAESADVITIWYLIVIACGCAVVARVSRASALTTVFALWLLVVSIRVAWIAI